MTNPFNNKNRLLLRIIRLVLLTFQLSCKLFFKVKKGEEILIVTNPAPFIICASWIAKIQKLKLNVIVHDVFPENLVAGNLIKRKNIIYKLLLKIFNKAYQNAHCLIVLGIDMKKFIEAKLSAVKKKPLIKIIENWADIDKITPSLKQTNKIVNDLDLENKLILQFAGNFGRLQGLMELLNIIQKVKTSSLHFIFIGEGAMKKEMNTFIIDNKITNVSLLSSFSRNEQQIFLNATDIGIVSLSANMYGLGVPSKVYNILAAGKPILYIGPLNSEICCMVKEYDIGWCYEPHSTLGILSFFEQLSQYDNLKLNAKGVRARTIAEEYYSRSVILQKYIHLFK